MSTNSHNDLNARRKAAREEGAMRGVDKNLLRNRPLADIERTVADARQRDKAEARMFPRPPQPITPEKAKEIEEERKAEIKAAVDDALKHRRDAPAAPPSSFIPPPSSFPSHPSSLPIEPSTTPSTPFKPVDVPKVNPAEVIQPTQPPSDFPQPTIASALVASAADTPEWTTDIGAGVGGVLVQQASGDTPAFVAGTASTKEVLYKDASTAAWVAGMPVPLPSTDDYLLQGDGTNNAVWSNDIPTRMTAAESDIDDLEAILGTQVCTVDTYLQSDGAGRFQCGRKGAVAATASTLVERDTDGSINAAGGSSSPYAGAVNGISTSHTGVLGASSSGVGTEGYSDTGYGVHGRSESNFGISGSSDGTVTAQFHNGHVAGATVQIMRDGSYEIDGDQIITVRQGSVADVASADATDLASAITLVNELKAQLNALLNRVREGTGHGLIDA